MQTHELSNRHFAYMLGMACILHISLVAGWALYPRDAVMEIPVRVLNLKLGDVENIPDPPADMEETAADAAPEQSDAVPSRPTSSIWKLLKKAKNITTPAPQPRMEQPKPLPPQPTPLAAALTQKEQQFIRPPETATVPLQSGGTPLGNSTSADAEEATRYEQIISGWMDKFKYVPPEAEAYHLPVNGQLRIQIDRHGNLRSSSIERSTGYMLLDRVMLDMARRANPFPAAPPSYAPKVELLAFITTITFKPK